MDPGFAAVAASRRSCCRLPPVPQLTVFPSQPGKFMSLVAGGEAKPLQDTTGITPCPVTSEWNAYAPKSDSRRVVPYTKKAVPKAIKPSAMSIPMWIDV